MKQMLPYFLFFILTQSILCMPFDMPDIEIDEPGDLENDVENGDRFEGDMEMSDEQLAAINGDRDVIIGATYRWENNTVPYVLSQNHTTEQNDYILSAMRDIENVSCIRFKNRTDEIDYVQFEANDDGCYSSVGRRGGKQRLNLKKSEKDQGCFVYGRILHELLHTLGFYHMQSATDRDDYVTINWDNIKANKTNNFKRYNSTMVGNFNITYDFHSIMHYNTDAFAKDRRFKTITPRVKDTAIGQRDELSTKDILKLKAMYKCEIPTTKPTFNVSDELVGCSRWAISRNLCHIMIPHDNTMKYFTVLNIDFISVI